MKPRWLIVATLALVSAVVLARLRTFSEPPERDLTTYAVIAHELLAGRELYSDLWDHKPPAIHVTYAAAELLAGYGLRAVYLLSVLATLLTMTGVFVAVRRGSDSDFAAYIAALFWVVIANDFHLQGNSPNTEVFINAALACAFALLIRLGPDDRHRSRRILWIGVLFAVATLYKHVAIAPVALLTLAHAVVPDRVRSIGIRIRIADLGTWAATGAFAWLAIAAYFAILGRFPDFWDAVFTYNRYYARGLAENVAAGLKPGDLYPHSLRFLTPLIAMLCLGALTGMRRAPRLWAVTVAYFLGSIVATGLHGGTYAHYYQLWLPAVVIGSALAVVELWHALRGPGRWLAPLTAGIAFLIALKHELPSYTHPAHTWSVERYGTEYVAAAELGRMLGRYLDSTQSFFSWGAESGLYFSSHRSPPTGTLYVMPLIAGPVSEALEARTIRQLEQRAVQLVIVNKAPYFPMTAGFDSLLDADFERVPGSPALDTDKPLEFYVRRGARIDPRILRWRYSGASVPTVGDALPW